MLCLLLTGIFLSTAAGCTSDVTNSFEPFDPDERVQDTRELTDQEYTLLNTVAADDFGNQSLPKDGVKTDKERYVGMFYFLTLGQHDNHTGIYNVTEILENYGREAFDSDSEISPVGAAHFWGEPVFGYYNSADEWVVYKQMEMLTLMGVDFLGLDVSNGVLYEDVVYVLLDVLADYRDQGWDVPQIVFYTHDYGRDGQSVVDNALIPIKTMFYDREEYHDLWFAPEGKPMVIAVNEAEEFLDAADANGPYAEIKDFFHFKYWVWPTLQNVNQVVKNGMPWMQWTYPQPIHYESQRGDANGAVNVSVAQHTTVRFSDTNGTRGRGWTPEAGNDHERYAENVNFQAQWETVHDNDDQIKYVFVTGWNEWVAAKMQDGSTCYTVDQYNDEYSRDLEPTRTGPLKDNAFLLSHKEIRDYKMTEARHYVYESVSPSVTDPADALWEKGKTYLDFTGEAIARNSYRMDGNLNYVDNSNRNDIASVTVARDSEFLYFRITTLEPITAYEAGDTAWMNIWLNTMNGGEKNALGYQYVINRSVSGNKSAVMKATGNTTYETVGEAEISVSGNTLCVKVALSDLGLSDVNYDIEFKVSDNMQSERDFLDFYSTGDCAPIGRLNFKFGY